MILGSLLRMKLTPGFSCKLIVLCSVIEICISVDILEPSQLMKEGDSLISVGEKFQLGFFSPEDNSENRYLGIWLHNIPNRTIVWVANKDHPLNDSAGIFKIGDNGSLVILDGSERLIWTSGDSSIPFSRGSKVIARLLDSGNLVLTEEEHNSVNSGIFLWQSFDYPADTLLAGMKIGWDLTNGFRRQLTSWKSLTDPSPGDFTYGIDIQGIPQIVIRKGSTKKYRTGPWIGGQFSGVLVNPPLIFQVQFTINSQDVHFTLDIYRRSPIARAVLTYEGLYELCMWSNDSQDWTVIKTLPSDSCDEYAKCGPNAVCTISDPRICSCLVGYVPKSTQEWDMLVWSGGCVRKNQSACPGNEGFKRIKGLKMPDLLSFRVNNSMSLGECKAECLSNCSCSAYANSDTTGEHGSGCILWYGNLIDIRQLTEGTNLDLFVRVMASDLDTTANSQRRKLLLITSLSLSVVFSMLFFWVLWRRGRKKSVVKLRDEENLELPTFDILKISQATNNFSLSSKIGEGGFGPVYKGRLPNGQEIAVKRLSKDSRQGIDEFMNEAIFIAKLQHRNLVRLLGCCIEGGERMLIYEYMSNGSMDSLIFGDRREKSLVWRKQFNIILGIARGLLYLHQDSRLNIIHRDLKASNVLLDGEFNPKISDFGMARTFDGDLSRAKTKRIVGTYGYMSPEYAIDGIFSVKSDVFSFGVIVLEIVSGKRNREFQHLEHSFNLIGHAWKLWEEDRAFELIDREMDDDLPASEVMRCIQVGLLCVQRHPEDRPTMSSVLMMLDSENFVLPHPKQPGFYAERNLEMNRKDYNSTAMTVTLTQGR